MDITFLEVEQIWGDDRGQGQLQVMKDYGTNTGMSDLAIVLGGFVGGNRTSDGQRTGCVWSASSTDDGYVRAVSIDGDRFLNEQYDRNLGARPALPSSITSTIQPNAAKPTRTIGTVPVVEYGEYPQTIVDRDVSEVLERAFSRNQLGTTGKTYMFDGEKSDAYDKSFKAEPYAEYRHQDTRYIRVEAQPYDHDSVLSNGRLVKNGEICWIEVQPIEWLKDPSGVWTTRQALFSGIPFDRNNVYDGNFEKTDMKRYLDTHFAKEMLATRQVETPAAITDKQKADTEENRQKVLKRFGISDKTAWEQGF